MDSWQWRFAENCQGTKTETLGEIVRVHQAAKENLAKAQEAMKRSADKHRRPTDFSEGDRVLLSTKDIGLTKLCLLPVFDCIACLCL